MFKYSHNLKYSICQRCKYPAKSNNFCNTLSHGMFSATAVHSVRTQLISLPAERLV